MTLGKITEEGVKECLFSLKMRCHLLCGVYSPPMDGLPNLFFVGYSSECLAEIANKTLDSVKHNQDERYKASDFNFEEVEELVPRIPSDVISEEIMGTFIPAYKRLVLKVNGLGE